MRKIIFCTSGLLLTVMGCQTEVLNIQRTFPFRIELDAFPTAIPLYKRTSIGFGVKPEYLTLDNVFMFSWQVAAPQKGILVLNKQVIEPGSKAVVLASMSPLLSDTLTYVPIDSGQHQLTLRVFDTMGQRKDTTFTLTAVK